MAHLPMDIINDLFLRLSASTLVRCRLLSKPCFSLVDNPDFVASHFKRTLETRDHLMILLRSPNVLRTVELDAPDNISDIDHPLQSEGLTEVFGSVNGVVGLCNSVMDIALFNPSTRKIIRLPFPPVDIPERNFTGRYVFYGLGYDSVNDDYKVVRMLQCNHHGGKNKFDYAIEVKVFSLKNNAWNKICLRSEVQLIFLNFYYNLLDRRGYGVLASNNLHWVAPRRQGVMAFNVILRFDLAFEDVGVLSFPQELHRKNDMDIGVLDGCVCLMCYEGFSYVDIWVQREYGIVGSWAKMFRVAKPESVESFGYVRPLLYSKDRSKILLEINNAKNLMWFDLASKSLTAFGIKECDSSFTAEILVSSLVLGCKGDLAEVKRRKEIMMQKRNIRKDFLSKGFKLKL